MGYRAIPEMRKSKVREIARLTRCFPRKHSLECDPQDPTQSGVIIPVISELGDWGRERISGGRSFLVSDF